MGRLVRRHSHVNDYVAPTFNTEEVVPMKLTRRLFALALSTTAIAFAMAGPASARDDERERHERDKTVTVSEFDVSWTLTDAQCSFVPPGTKIDGTGSLVVVFTESTNRRGETTWDFDARAHGSATDQDGNVYEWRYHNILRETNTVAEPDVFTGPTTDAFRLKGDGPIRLRNGFRAVVTDDYGAGTVVFNNLTSFGDPFDFVNIRNRCDPL